MTKAQSDVIRAGAMISQSTQELILQDFFAIHGKQMMTEMDMQQLFEVKFGKKTKRATTESRERSAEQFFDTLEPVALAVEGSDLGTTEDPI